MRAAVSDSARLVLAQIHVHGLWMWERGDGPGGYWPATAVLADSMESTANVNSVFALLRRELLEEVEVDGVATLHLTERGREVVVERPEILAVVQEQAQLARTLAGAKIRLRLAGRNSYEDRVARWLSPPS